MVLAPELYKVAVAICPVYDLDDQNAFAIEPYMGLPVDRPDAYRAGSSVEMADRIQGKLLMIHGTSDVNATFSATMKMCEGLARANKPYDLVVLPGANHPFTAGGLHQQRYMHAAALRYFVEHLSLS
jgi:dipeptidyl aminopeptidase/acylaminoacyl peptidase